MKVLKHISCRLFSSPGITQTRANDAVRLYVSGAASLYASAELIAPPAVTRRSGASTDKPPIKAWPSDPDVPHSHRRRKHHLPLVPRRNGQRKFETCSARAQPEVPGFGDQTRPHPVIIGSLGQASDCLTAA